jgi:PAS domain S-box-containing protein
MQSGSPSKAGGSNVPSGVAFLSLPGEVSRRMRAHDWSKSPLGPPETWPQSLRSVVGLMLGSKFPMFAAWGPELTFLYNDAYVDVLGDKHPAALGRPFREVWSEIWADIAPLIDKALSGQASWLENLPLTMNRHGYGEGTYFTFSYSPLQDESGAIAGMFCACTETTAQIIGERKLRASEARATGVLEGMAEGFILLDRDFHVLEINAEGLRIDGRSREAVIGRSHWEAWPGTEQSQLGRLYCKAMAERVPVSLEHCYTYPDGHTVWFDMRAYPHPEGLALFYRDVTARRQAEEERQRLAAIVEQSTDFIGIAKPDGHAVYVNEAGRRLVGLADAASVKRTRVIDYFADRDRDKVEREVLPAVYASGHWEGELSFRDFPAGGETPVFFNMFAVRDAAGQIIAYATVTRDLTERNRAEARLREAERRLNAVLDNATVSVLLMDDRQRCVYMNRAAEQLTGYTLEEVLARDCPLHDIVHHTYPDGRPFPLHECAIDRAFPEDVLTQGEVVFVHKDGHFYPVAFTASPIHDEASRTVGTIIEVRDISAEKAHEAALRASRDRLASERHALEVLNRTGSRIAAELELDRLVQTIVDAGVELTGAQFGAFFYNVLDEARGKYMLYALSGAERSAFEKFGMPRATEVFAPTFLGEGVIRSADILQDDRYGRNAPHSGMPKGHLPVRSYLAVPVTSRSGEVIGGLFFGHPKPNVFSERSEQLMSGLAAQAAIGIDNARLFQTAQQANATLEQRVEERTAELRKTEEALRQSQKMEAVGQLTGGLAHDFNNLLTGISGSLELLQTRMAQGRLTDLDRYINAAQGASKRAAALTHRLLAFSRRQTLDPKPTDVNGLIFGMEELIRRTVGPSISVEVVGSAGLWLALVDPPQLENALLNLCINARDAMPEGGRITVETANKWLDDRAAKERDLPPGQYLSLCVSDTGSGMTPEVIARAFDPFFTTKPLGQGTGLGLSMIYGFVRQSGGQVRIYSEVGQGTTMCLYLPRHYGTAEGEDELANLSDAPRAEQGETVLIVDDEPSVRMLVTEVLEDLGYTAIEAADGPSGLKVLQSDVRLDLLVTDVGLPGGMNGRQMADAGRLVRPGLKVLFITGYAENAAVGNGHLEPGMQVLTKPFVMETLASRIREMIGSKV